MELEKVAFSFSVLVVAGVIAREWVRSQVQVKIMAIHRGRLQQLLDDSSFESLSFNPFFDNRTLKRDRVQLMAYRKTGDNTEKILPEEVLEETGRELSFEKDRDYSAYHLSRENIQKILTRYADEEVEYILFEPTLYAEDKRYLAYRLLPADKAKKPLPIEFIEKVSASARAMATQQGDERQGRAETVPLAVSAQLRQAFYLNPCPPATSDFS